jgi:serine phosphatase RsbU (regulator of sigma subunit)
MSDDDLLAALADPDRLDALFRTGLGAAADPMFDRFAAIVRDVLAVPVALVSLVDTDRQILPGACGLAEPWAQVRQTPLSHSFCQHVVHTAEPLVVTDARADARLLDNLAIRDLGVIAYAGMPLTDADGAVLGSLCAIDTEPRRWSDSELGLLADLASACSDSLRLRIATGSAQRSVQAAHADRRRTTAAFDRTQMLLRASVALTDTSTVTDVIAAVRRLVTGTLDPAYVGLSLLDGRAVVVATGEALPPAVTERWNRYRTSKTTPSALAIASGAPVLLPDPASVVREAPDAAETFTEMGWQSAASLPLPGPSGPIGALTFVWKEAYSLDEASQAVLAAMAGYVAQALQRAETLADRRTAAATMQKALLSDLPKHDHLTMAAQYLPAHHADHVGGDWYDAISIDENRLALVIGDVTGHSIHAAAAMSQLRSILRALVVDRHESPAAILRRLEDTSRALGSISLASAVLAYLDTTATGSHVLTWANAGHPPPLLRTADGATTVLAEGDALLGAVRHATRHNHSIEMSPGAVLLLYTDGLVESRQAGIDEGIAEVRRLLAAHDDPDRLTDQLVTHRASYEDDVAVLAVRTPPAFLARPRKTHQREAD